MRMVRLIASIIPDNVLLRIPVVGVADVIFPGKARLLFQTEGYDYTTALLYWRGLGGYEQGTIRLYLSILKHVETFIDVGANTGLYSLIAAAERRERLAYGFEPVPRIYDAFLRNIYLNGFKNCHGYCQAVGDYDGDITLFVPRGKIPTGATANPERSPKLSVQEEITVPMVKLDTFIAREGIRGVDLIKIDTETTEPRVLAGARETIACFRPFIICEVLRGKTETELQGLMDNCRDYRYFWITPDELMARDKIIGDNRSMNYLFVPEEKVHQVL
jgi:FkbM family methyltransferase